MQRAHPRRQRPRKPEHGVVLVVVLVMLIAIVFMSVSVMRGALGTDTVVNNARTQTLATETAELALRFCEQDLRKVGVAGATVALFTDNPAILPASTTTKAGSTHIEMAWEKAASWSGGSAKSLTSAQLGGTTTSIKPTKAPQCLAEYSPDAGTGQVIVLTVRAFSPDYTEDSNNKVTSGSVVWLQSRFLLS